MRVSEYEARMRTTDEATPVQDLIRSILSEVPGCPTLRVEGDPALLVMPYHRPAIRSADDAVRHASDIASMIGWEIVFTPDGLTLRENGTPNIRGLE